MQCLANCDPFLEAVLNSDHRRSCPTAVAAKRKSLDGGKLNSFVHSGLVDNAPLYCVQCALENCILQIKYPALFQQGMAKIEPTDNSFIQADSFVQRQSSSHQHPLNHIISILPLIAMEFGRQEDAHEFLLNLLLCVKSYSGKAIQSSSMQDLNAEQNPYIALLCGSSLSSRITCLDCGSSSAKSEQIQDIQLDINKATTLFSAMNEFCR